VAIQETLVTSANPTVYGQTTAYQNPPPASVSGGTVAVVNADTAAGAPTNYPNLTFKFAPGNVGNATLAPTGGTFAGASTLTGFVPRGFSLGTFAAPTPVNPSPNNISLSSKVLATGTAASVPAGTPLDSSNVYGPVGSEAQILTSTKVGADTNIAMSWRPRTAQESGQTPSSGVLPSDAKWLTSDVVKVTGIPDPGGSSPMAYAMQMNFDSRINKFFDGPTDGATLAEFNAGSLYLAEFTGVTWQNAVLGNATVGSYVLAHPEKTIHQPESLSDFLNYNLTNLSGDPDAILRSLVGSWGVDTNTDQAWAILDHSGTLAVVPEPATIILLLAAGVGTVGYFRWRRRSSRAVVS
jgi:hypothetical protein